MGAMPNETDRNDARAIAQIMRTGWFRAVHVKTPACRSWRSLSVSRRTVLNEMRTIENVVRAILRETGLKCPSSEYLRQKAAGFSGGRGSSDG